jgi:putative transcriptional regulator
MPTKISEIMKELEGLNCEYTIVNYPKTKKSVDMVINAPKRKLVLKISNKVDDEDIEDLKKFSTIPSTIPLIITNKAEEDIAIEKDGIIGVSLEGLSKAIRGEKLYLYRTRGGIFIKINSEVLKRKRLKLGYSLGDMSKLLGVSRKAVYDYEHGSTDVSLEVAEKLIEIFGEDIIGDILESKIEVEEDKPYEVIIKEFKRRGFKVFKLKKTAIDLVLLKEDKRILATIETNDKNETENKFNEAKKVAELLKLDLVYLTKKYIKKEDFKAVKLNNIMEISNEIERDY